MQGGGAGGQAGGGRGRGAGGHRAWVAGAAAAPGRVDGQLLVQWGAWCESGISDQALFWLLIKKIFYNNTFKFMGKLFRLMCIK